MNSEEYEDRIRILEEDKRAYFEQCLSLRKELRELTNETTWRDAKTLTPIHENIYDIWVAGTRIPDCLYVDYPEDVLGPHFYCEERDELISYLKVTAWRELPQPPIL